MVVVYCVISFILGWRLSTWAKSEPFAQARAAYGKGANSEEIVQTSPSQVSRTTADVDDMTILSDSQSIPAAELEKLDEVQQDESGAWLFDAAYLDEEDDADADLDATAQAQKYFLDNFHDEEQLLSQRVSALKAALSMSEALLDDALLQDIYQLLVKQADESHHPDDFAYLLGLLQGHIDEHRLPGLAIYLKSAIATIREEALKAIAPVDHHGAYRKQVEYILNNDPHMEVRALAFVLLEQHYDGAATEAA